MTFNIYVSYTVRILCVIALIAADSFLAAYVPQQAKKLLNDTLSGTVVVLYGVGLYAIFKFLGSSLRYINDIVFFPIINDCIRIFKFSTCKHIAQLPLLESEAINSAVTVSRFWRMTLSMYRVFKTLLAQIIPTIVKFFVIFTALYKMNVLGGYGLILSCMGVGLIASVVYGYARLKAQAWVLMDQTNAVAQDYLTNTYWHKYYFSSFSNFLGQWFQKEADIWGAQNIWLNLVLLTFEVSALLFTFCILYFTFIKIQSGALSGGDFLVVEGYLIALLVPIRELFLELRAIIDTSIDLKPVADLFKQKKEKRTGVVNNHVKSALVLDQVSFVYPGQNNLITNCSLRLGKGDRLSIEGQNGTGKTTLCHLILGLLPPSSGLVLWKETSVHSIPFDVLSQDMMYISGQHPFLDQTVCMHMMLGQDTIQTERIKKALLDVGTSLDLQANMGSLSQGQKQKVLLAKALLVQPKVLVLDEGLSMIDSDSLQIILSMLDACIDILVVVSHQQNLPINFTHHIRL